MCQMMCHFRKLPCKNASAGSAAWDECHIYTGELDLDLALGPAKPRAAMLGNDNASTAKKT